MLAATSASRAENERRPRRPRWHPLVCAVLVAASCAGDGPRRESGADCWDGKDNDGDGRIDCDDEDCTALAICGGKPDAGRDQRAPDLRRPLDLARPDQRPDAVGSSFGQKCTLDPPLAPCPDGKTYCIPMPSSSSATGFCSARCTAGQIASCPTVPSTQGAFCIYTVNSQPFCLFACLLAGQGYACPTGFSCSPYQVNQSLCAP